MKIILVIISNLIILTNLCWADDAKPRHANAPYYCNGLQLKNAHISADGQLKSYHFSGICSVREGAQSGDVYKRIWLEINAKWDVANNTATEVSEITAGDSGKIQMHLKCDDDPWVTNAKCIIQKLKNKSKLSNFENRFKIRKLDKGQTMLAGYPPIARHVTNSAQVAQFSHKKHQSVVKKKLEQHAKAKIIVLPHIKKISYLPKYAKKERERRKLFEKPTHKGHRIAWCYRWGSNCGKSAADAWCKFNKFDFATTFKIDYNLGKTLIFGDNRLCLHRTCAGFDKIVCEKKVKQLATINKENKK